MAIPWLIGAAVAAGVTALAKSISDSAEEDARAARRERQREEEREMERENEAKRQQAQARERQQAEAQRKTQIKHFAAQSANTLIQKYGLIGVSSEHIAELSMIDLEEAKRNLQQKYPTSKSAKDLQKEVAHKQQALSQVDELLKSIEKV